MEFAFIMIWVFPVLMFGTFGLAHCLYLRDRMVNAVFTASRAGAIHEAKHGVMGSISGSKSFSTPRERVEWILDAYLANERVSCPYAIDQLGPQDPLYRVSIHCEYQGLFGRAMTWVMGRPLTLRATAAFHYRNG